MTLLTFLLGLCDDCDSHISAFLDIYLFFDSGVSSPMAFTPLGNSDHVVSVSIDFPSNSKRDAPFHHIAYYYSHADWDSLHDHLREMFHGKISLSLVLLLLLVNFVSGFSLELVYMSLIISIMSNLTLLHGFQFSTACAASLVHGNHFFCL